MRTLLIASLFVSATLSGAAYAAPAVTQDATASSMTVQVTAGTQHKLTPYEYKTVQGEYAMSNGATMKVTGEGRKLYAELDGHARTEIIPIGNSVFSARDDDMTLTFERQAFWNEAKVDLPAKK